MENKSFQLYDCIMSTQEITCDKCGESNTVTALDDTEACDYFYDEGWRSVGHNGNCICPKCRKKKAKKKSKSLNK